MNSPVNSQTQFTTPLGPTSQTTSQSQAATTNNMFAKKNLNQLKPIDSVDSVSGLLDGPMQAEANGPSKAFISQNKKFSNIVESDVDLSSPKYKSNNEKTNFEYNFIKNDNDNVNISRPNSNNIRAPITPIIKHYEKTNINNTSPISTNSISMKLDPHPASHLKSFENYNDKNDQHHSSSSTNNSSSKSNRTSNENQKFNGKLFVDYFSFFKGLDSIFLFRTLYFLLLWLKDKNERT